MPFQNRVLATGEIIAHPARGRFMGNRGILHDVRQRIGTARWRHKAWIICVLRHKDWHRQVMRPGNYTELFFLDEAVALAAGHRPCKLCRRDAYIGYTTAAGHDGPAPDLDHRLHLERAVPRRFQQRRHKTDIAELPDGAILFDDSPKLVLGDTLRAVSPEGYGPAQPRPTAGRVTVLTPPTSLAALRGGYTPSLHPSSNR
ncbi:MAG: hypothetical protein EX266_16175 [Rhodobacteraceae bacterium]|nr:MAG: hypothetical protein EX266_16175 [Paracoccaceae bacterium]